LPQSIDRRYKSADCRILQIEFEGGLAAGNYADEFNPIAVREFALWPFALMERDGVVLDENAVWLQTVMAGQFRHSR
jgi:hypothetical protein